MAARKTGRRLIVNQPGFVVEAHASLDEAEALRILKEVERDFKENARAFGVSSWVGSFETDYESRGKEVHVKLTMTKDQTVHIRMAAPKKRPAWKDELLPVSRGRARKMLEAPFAIELGPRGRVPKKLPAPKRARKKGKR